MPFNINAFASTLSRHSISRSDMFEMDVHVPPKVGAQFKARTGSDYVPRDMTLRVDSADIPQRSVTAVGLQDYGVPYKLAGIPNYVDITATILLSDDLRERELFLAWQDVMVGNHRTQARNAPPGDGLQVLREQAIPGIPPRQDGGPFATPNKNAFDIGYYDDYKSDGIVIHKYNSIGLETHRLRLIDAFPLIVSSISQSWASTEFDKQPITISFRYFVDEYLGNPISRIKKAINGGDAFSDIDPDTIVRQLRDRLL